ncbi:MAG: uroporphyrinogen decarboxylase (URO-D) [Blautia sp.]|nr:uroporphyrinogen decarboxylase (URO-D) [Blautia sp.]
MTQREAVYALLRGEKPGVIVNGWEPFRYVYDELLIRCNPAPPEGKTESVDCWGVTFLQDASQPGGMPSEKVLACDDITEWKEQLTVPDVDAWDLNWDSAIAQRDAAHADGKIALSFLPCGVFEEAHHILGFEEALVDFLIEPDDMHELVEALFEHKMKCVRRQMEAWKPDAFLLHDDWGSKDNLLLPPDVWRDYFKEGYRRIFQYIHDNGSFVVLHSDSNNALIAADMEEIGVDIWQGALPSADIARLQKELPGNMIFMGGYDSAIIDRAATTPEEIRAEVTRACTEYLPNGKFIPCITYGAPESIFPGVDEQITQVIRELQKSYK